MIEEIFRTYSILLLNDNVSPSEKLIISKDALEVSERLLKKLESDSKGTVPWNKLRLLRTIAKQHNEGITSSFSLEKLFADNTKFHDFKDEIYSFKNTVMEEAELEHFKHQLILEKQFLGAEDYISKFKHYVEKIENREFEETADIQSELKDIIENLYMGFIRETNLAQSLDGVKTIDYNDSDILLNHMQQFYSGKNYVPTGYSNIDKLFGGGLERTRLYMFAGKPGSGKSTIMLNLMYNMSQLIKNGQYPDTYVLYISLENLALETNQRMLCKHLNMSQGDVESIVRTRDSNGVIKGALNDFHDSNIVISYYPSRTFSTSDLYSYVEALNAKRGQKPLAIYVDYLDIMRLPTFYSELRHQLGDIALGLKNLAVLHKVPVVTATQLLKGAYEGTPTLGTIKESSEKIDYADAIGLIHRLDNGENIEEHIEQFGHNVEISFDKSRASANGRLKFAMFLNKFSIEEARDDTYSYKAFNDAPVAPNNAELKPPSPFQSPTVATYQHQISIPQPGGQFQTPGQATFNNQSEPNANTSNVNYDIGSISI